MENSNSTAFKPGEITVVFVLGGPGSGKGTQSVLLVKDYGFVHLSAGDLLREEQSFPGSENGKLISEYISEGKIVPERIIIELLLNSIQRNFDKGNKKFLIDGFPRKMDQALTFERKIAESSFILFFDCPEEVLETRLLERGKTSGRTDDNLASIKKRFRVFAETSLPVVNHYEAKQKVVRISSEKPIDQVYSAVKAALEARSF
ncbi:UMP-CMP kinase [Ascoidea rubescens DSM 1968]|uniref:Uridylate kinase n=1 Tax=Ascoidea rubescens DSM 1968 TaxID=1344418 RepID=A0A1D2VFK4_9ASCO|nr:UMP-CMP kinase [Ascoidea rubescens DSM 1968]ODV60300.1 UMP-CMP kinase [Ascoidea rubescens DSM 1968]